MVIVSGYGGRSAQLYLVTPGRHPLLFLVLTLRGLVSSRGNAKVSALVVPGERIELSHPCEYWILSPTRLPIPPSRPRRTLTEGKTLTKMSACFQRLISMPRCR